METTTSRSNDFRQRTKQFALRVIRMYPKLPRRMEAQVLGRQVLRSGTSVGANYREALRARTPAEFVSKLRLALQEIDETAYWLELLAESGIVAESRLAPLRKEADELTAMLVTSVNKAKRSANKR
jgi:four helix bundle protein